MYCVFKHANMYPWSIQSLGSFLGATSSKLLASLIQSIIEYSDFPCSQNLRVHVSKGTSSHDPIPVSVKKTLLRRRRSVGKISFGDTKSGAGEQC